MRDSFSLYTDQLTGEYKNIFEQIELYMMAGSFDMDYDTYEERMMELLDIFLSAQREERPVERIVGRNVEHFCKVFYQGNGVKGVLVNLMESGKSICWGFFILSLIDLIFAVISFGFGDMTEEEYIWGIPLLPYFASLALAWIVSSLFGLLVRKIMFRRHWLSLKLYMIIQILFVVCTVVVTMYILSVSNSEHIPSLVICIFSGILLALYYTLNRRKLRERRANRISYVQYVRDSMPEGGSREDYMGCSFHKRFARINRRRQRHGKAPLTWNEFLDKLIRETRFAHRLWCINFLIPPAFALFLILYQLFAAEGFDSWGELFACVGVLCLIYYPINLLLYRLSCFADEMRLKWIADNR